MQMTATAMSMIGALRRIHVNSLQDLSPSSASLNAAAERLVSSYGQAGYVERAHTIEKKREKKPICSSESRFHNVQHLGVMMYVG